MSLHHICAQSKQERWFLIQMVEQVLVDPHPVFGPRPCEPLNVSGTQCYPFCISSNRQTTISMSQLVGSRVDSAVRQQFELNGLESCRFLSPHQPHGSR